MSDQDGVPPPPSDVEFKGKTYSPLADGKYDYIILGTGLKESILSGLLSKSGKKVLHLDKNGYYGGECASLNLSQLYKKFIKDEEPPKEFFDALGANRDYNVDLIPKFLMANGNLVKILIKTDVTRYLDFKSVGGSFVYKSGKGIFKVPASLEEALKTNLVSFLQKKWLQSALKFIAKYDKNDPKTHDGMDLTKMTAREFFKKMWFDADTSNFVAHAMALELFICPMQSDDSYLDKPALPLVEAIRLYGESLERYGKSPFLYPMYGLGMLPESFSRLCAVYGGTFILNQSVDEILYNDDGTVAGIRSGDQVALASTIIGDPTYFPKTMLKHTGRVIRSICISNQPIKGLEGVDSAQIILPQSQIGRKNNIYISCVGYSHSVCAENKYIAIISTNMEGNNPQAEIKAGLDLVGGRIVQFDNICDTFVPLEDGSKTRLFITESYDASSHFESTTNEVIRMYKLITGEDLDLSAPAEVDTTD